MMALQWGSESAGSAQLAFAILLAHRGIPVDAIAEYKNFQKDVITKLKKGEDFDFAFNFWP